MKTHVDCVNSQSVYRLPGMLQSYITKRYCDFHAFNLFIEVGCYAIFNMFFAHAKFLVMCQMAD